MLFVAFPLLLFIFFSFFFEISFIYFFIQQVNNFSLYLIFECLINMCLDVFLLGFILYGTLRFLDLTDCFLSHNREVFNYNLFKYFLRPFLFLFFFCDLQLNYVSHRGHGLFYIESEKERQPKKIICVCVCVCVCKI